MKYCDIYFIPIHPYFQCLSFQSIESISSMAAVHAVSSQVIPDNRKTVPISLDADVADFDDDRP